MIAAIILIALGFLTLLSSIYIYSSFCTVKLYSKVLVFALTVLDFYLLYTAMHSIGAWQYIKMLF